MQECLDQLQLRKLLSALATVIGSVKQSKQAVIIFGKLEDDSDFCILSFWVHVNLFYRIVSYRMSYQDEFDQVLDRFQRWQCDTESYFQQEQLVRQLIWNVIRVLPDQTLRHFQQFVIIRFSNCRRFQACEDLVSISQWFKSCCYLDSGVVDDSVEHFDLIAVLNRSKCSTESSTTPLSR